MARFADIRLGLRGFGAGRTLAFCQTVEPTKQPEECSIDGADGLPSRTEAPDSSTTVADRRIYLWHVMGFTDVDIAAHLDIAVRDVCAVLERCKASADSPRRAEDNR